MPLFDMLGGALSTAKNWFFDLLGPVGASASGFQDWSNAGRTAGAVVATVFNGLLLPVYAAIDAFKLLGATWDFVVKGKEFKFDSSVYKGLSQNHFDTASEKNAANDTKKQTANWPMAGGSVAAVAKQVGVVSAAPVAAVAPVAAAAKVAGVASVAPKAAVAPVAAAAKVAGVASVAPTAAVAPVAAAFNAVNGAAGSVGVAGKNGAAGQYAAGMPGAAVAPAAFATINTPVAFASPSFTIPPIPPSKVDISGRLDVRIASDGRATVDRVQSNNRNYEIDARAGGMFAAGA
jgi:hypothetical protein